MVIKLVLRKKNKARKENGVWECVKRRVYKKETFK